MMMMRTRDRAAVYSLLLTTLVACSLGQTTVKAAFLSNQQASRPEQAVGGGGGGGTKSEESANRSPSSFGYLLPNNKAAAVATLSAPTRTSNLWGAATANGGTRTDTDTSSAAAAVDVDVDVVLFGVGDLRTNDHYGLYQALTGSSAGATATATAGSRSRSRILPVVLLSDDQLASLPGSISHTADTASLLAAALMDLEQSLMRDYGLPLHVQLTGEISLAQALTRLVSSDTSRSDSDSDIRVHVSDLGDADNAMGYGSFGALQKKGGQGLPVDSHMKVQTWSSHLRAEPWTTSSLNRLPDKYTEYEAVYAGPSKPPAKPLVMPKQKRVDESRVWKKQSSTSSSSSTTDLLVPTADMIQDRIMTRLALDPVRCAAERNTGLFSTHWGGLDASTVGSSKVESNLHIFVQDCHEQDDLWSQHEAYVTRNTQSNERSLEHAAMRWQLAGNGQKSLATGGHTENWLAGESMTRYLAAPLFLGTISPTTVFHVSNSANHIQAFFTSPLQVLVEGQEWHRLLAARNMQTDPAYDYSDSAGQGSAGAATKYRYWRWHGYLCRYAVTNLIDKKTVAAAATTTTDDNHQEGIVLLHGFGASGSQWNKAMQELAQTPSPTATQGLAPDLIGFGQSEKPALSYTSYLWDAYSMDFIKEIAVGAPAGAPLAYQWESYSVGGNSIGGFTSICVAASDTAAVDSRSLSSSGAPGTGKCTGLVLMNSAGPISSREEIEALQSAASQGSLNLRSVAQNTAMDALPVCEPPFRPFARLFGNGLLSVLRPNIQKICQNLYPTNPAAVDEALCESILRDSLDPGAINVMISGGKLPPPRTANELLAADFGGVVAREGVIAESTFDGPVLISTGVLDPLNDARDRTMRFGALRKGISIDECQAGHCPHDESPAEIALSISKWLTATRVERVARVTTAKSLVRS